MLGCLSQSSGKWYKTASVVFKDSKEFPKYGIKYHCLSLSISLFSAYVYINCFIIFTTDVQPLKCGRKNGKTFSKYKKMPITALSCPS